MSLINDALKRARQAPPRLPQNPFPTLPPAAAPPASAAAWLIPAVIIFLVVAAVISIGWAVAHRSVQTPVLPPPAAVAPAPAPTGQIVAGPAAVPIAEISPPPAVAPSETPPPLNPPNAPKLQGIFYSPAAPTAIVDGKTVSVGSRCLQYRVTEITKSTVTLTGPDGKAIKLGMDN